MTRYPESASAEPRASPPFAIVGGRHHQTDSGPRWRKTVSRDRERPRRGSWSALPRSLPRVCSSAVAITRSRREFSDASSPSLQPSCSRSAEHLMARRRRRVDAGRPGRVVGCLDFLGRATTLLVAVRGTHARGRLVARFAGSALAGRPRRVVAASSRADSARGDGSSTVGSGSAPDRLVSIAPARGLDRLSQRRDDDRAMGVPLAFWVAGSRRPLERAAGS